MRAVGYILVFSPFTLLLTGQLWNIPWLAFAVIFGVGPLLRSLTGNVPERTVLWSERTAGLLDRLPIVYAVFATLATVTSIVLLSRDGVPGSLGFWYGASLWTCCFFAVVVAHELIHQSTQRRRLGQALAAIAGYPLLLHEHLMHHSTSGNVELAEWPRLDESVWRFTMRRTVRVWRSTVEHNALQARRRGRGILLGGAAEALALTSFTAVGFLWAAGLHGLLIYLGVAVALHFGVQAVTYLQHWGLGVDSVADADQGRYAWEDRCQFQGWLMLNLALHHAHHQESRLPYYRVVPYRGSPRLPAGYVLLLLTSFVPPIWRWLLLPALRSWKVDPLRHVEPQGWRLVCLPQHFEKQSL
ncbi:fatty acid desaturase [Aquincola tertiaricarbonis]|uniref:fatty acid desaturase n=1 Tax=Aquincola tertiaricarbonis TaxID=391953 RepID=UPI0009F96860|nr:fatty acid desaturase [Aquincola tertiaricarbonis]